MGLRTASTMSSQCTPMVFQVRSVVSLRWTRDPIAAETASEQPVYPRTVGAVSGDTDSPAGAQTVAPTRFHPPAGPIRKTSVIRRKP